MNVRFVLRGSALAVSAALLVVAIALLAIGPGRQWLTSLPPVVPAVPTLTGPRGALPTSSGGLVEWTRYGSDQYRPVGRGFLFRLPTEEVIGVTTAHSLSFSAKPPLSSIALARREWTDRVIEFKALHGEPGEARTGEDMTVDYVLLHVPIEHVLDPAIVLEPDPRGLPEPGERVALYSPVNDKARVFHGAVLSVNPSAVWVVMDEAFDPSGLSGSPFLSHHTGKVLLGLHPMGSLMQKAQAAGSFPLIAHYRR
jgi:hypothetical protein